MKRSAADIWPSAGSKKGRSTPIVLDIMMGGGSGQDVLRALAVERPDQKCVVVISATSQPNLDTIEIANVKSKLRKPFNITELVDAVNECLVQ